MSRRYSGDSRDYDQYSKGRKRYYSDDQLDRRRSRDDFDDQPWKRKKYGDPNAPVPKLYSVFSGEVVTLQPYGAFIKIPDTTRQGLVHKSQMSKARIDDPSEYLSVRERVWCKVISLEEEGRKIGLSMKCVNQATGEDQDPTNIQSTRFEGFRRGYREPIHLEAVLDTTCKKCGGKGHFAQDCFHSRREKSYDLVPDFEEYSRARAQPESPSKHKKHKEKKSKKKKKEKKKKKKHRQSDSDSDHQEKLHKHKKKRQKVERRPSSSSSDSS